MDTTSASFCRFFRARLCILKHALALKCESDTRLFASCARCFQCGEAVVLRILSRSTTLGCSWGPPRPREPPRVCQISSGLAIREVPTLLADPSDLATPCHEDSKHRQLLGTSAQGKASLSRQSFLSQEPHSQLPYRYR